MRHLAVRVKPISFALRACFLGHYRMARMSQSASSCGLASWMRPHMVPNAYLLKLLFPTRYTSRSIYQSSVNQHEHDRCARMWSGHLFAKIVIPCTILPLAQFTCHLGNQRCSAEWLWQKRDWYNYLSSKNFTLTSKRPDSYFYESGRFLYPDGWSSD